VVRMSGAVATSLGDRSPNATGTRKQAGGHESRAAYERQSAAQNALAAWSALQQHRR